MIKKRSGRKTAGTHDPKKDSHFKLLSSVLADAGYVVRREKLKQGHGWKVTSGNCRAVGDRLVFVDRKLSQDDQISFLISQISSLGISVDPERVADLPEPLRESLIPSTVVRGEVTDTSGVHSADLLPADPPPADPPPADPPPA